MQIRFAAVPNCIQLLWRVISARQSTIQGGRNDVVMKLAAQILNLMAQRQKENLGKFKIIQTHLYIGSCLDDLAQGIYIYIFIYDIYLYIHTLY
jgi:hypothetical protein